MRSASQPRLLQSAALQPRVNVARHRGPLAWRAPRERVELIHGQLIALLADLEQRLARTLDEPAPHVFIGEQPTDYELHCLLRHVSGVPRKLRASERPTRLVADGCRLGLRTNEPSAIDHMPSAISHQPSPMSRAHRCTLLMTDAHSVE